MKKTFTSMLVVASLFVGGAVFANTHSDNARAQKVYVLTDNPAVKAALGVEHEFPGMFSTKASAKSKALEKIGAIKTKPVQIYEVTGRPVCGDNLCQGNEPKSCPEDCAGTPDPEPEPDRSCFPTMQTPWGVEMISGGAGGNGVTVAVLDTGVYKEHADLQSRIVSCKDTTKRGVKNGCTDRNGHGTHVSGTIAADAGSDRAGIYGVAQDANLMAIKVCGADGSCYGDDIAAAIEYAADNGAHVISMSLGGDTSDFRIAAAVEYAVSRGVLIVAAAGNDGPSDGSIDYPGAYVDVMAVGAIDANEAVATWSSRGRNDGDYVIEQEEVEFGAPGVSVNSTWTDGCYREMSGTSMATPHIAGLAAKVWQGNAENTRTYLQDLAQSHDLHTSGDDTATGFGLPIAPAN